MTIRKKLLTGVMLLALTLSAAVLGAVQPTRFVKAEEAAVDRSFTFTQENVQNKSFVFFGDSLTARAGLVTGDLDYMQLLQRDFGFTYTNCAVSGATWTYIPTSSNNVFTQIDSAVASGVLQTVDYVSIMLGTNDYGAARPLGTVEDAPAESAQATTVYGAIRYALNRILEVNPDVKIMLMTPPPRMDMGGFDVANAAGVTFGDVRDAVKTVGAEYGCKIYDMTTALPEDLQYFNADKLHISPAGYIKLAEHIKYYEGYLTGGTELHEHNEPAVLTIVTDENRETLFNTYIGNSTTETYNPATRKFQATPSVVETEGGTLYASWMTGDANEPGDNNYGVIARSDDGGKTWIDPLIIIDFADPQTRGAEFSLVPMVGNRLELRFVSCDNRIVNLDIGNQKGNTIFDHTSCIIIENPDADPEDLVIGDEKILLADSGYSLHLGVWQAPQRIKEGDREYLMLIGNVANRAIRILVSEDEGATWQLRSEINIESIPSVTFPEATVAQMPNGDLWILHRIEGGNNGGVGRFISHDFGRTWGEYQNNLPDPLIGPGSMASLKTLPSGNVLFVANNSTTSRTNLTIFLTEDGGKTWSDFVLDVGVAPSYPRVSLCSDNKHFIVSYDYLRTSDKEMRYGKFTEADIKAGKIVSEGSYSHAYVNKLGGKKEIVAIEEEFEHNYKVKVGTVTAADVEKVLPATLHAKDENGTEFTLRGNWDFSNVRFNKVGRYFARFNASLPAATRDARNFTVVKITVGDYGDRITGTAETFDRTVKVDFGTDLAEAVKSLPTTLTIRDENNATYTVTGSWQCAAYRPTKSGTYTATFVSSDMPFTLDDADGVLAVAVTVDVNHNPVVPADELPPIVENLGGLTAATVATGVVAVAGLAAVVVLLILGRKKKGGNENV